MLYKIWSIRPKWLPLDVKTFKNRDEILLTISQSRPVWTSGVTFGIEQIQLLGQAGRPWQHAATWYWNWTGIKVAVIKQLFSCKNQIVLYVLNRIESPKISSRAWLWTICFWPFTPNLACIVFQQCKDVYCFLASGHDYSPCSTTHHHSKPNTQGKGTFCEITL